MTIDLSNMSARELRALITQAEKQQKKVLTRPKASAMRAKINQYVRDHGYTIDELYGAPAAVGPGKPKKTGPRKNPKGRTLGKVAPKYRSPVNPDETWTGRGRQPKWMAELVAKGGSPDDFLIV